MLRNSPRHPHPGPADADHGPRLSARHDRHCRRAVSEAGARQPDREGRQGDRLRPDRAGVQGRQILPWPALGDLGRRTRPIPTKTVSAPYNAANSGGSNLGPTSKALNDRIKEDVEKLKAENPSAAVPIDLVTTSASGLDPDISPEAALFQVPRVAKARNMPEDRVRHAGRREHQGPLRRPARRAQRQRIGAQSGAGRGCSRNSDVG